MSAVGTTRVKVSGSRPCAKPNFTEVPPISTTASPPGSRLNGASRIETSRDLRGDRELLSHREHGLMQKVGPAYGRPCLTQFRSFDGWHRIALRQLRRDQGLDFGGDVVIERADRPPENDPLRFQNADENREAMSQPSGPIVQGAPRCVFAFADSRGQVFEPRAAAAIVAVAGEQGFLADIAFEPTRALAVEDVPFFADAHVADLAGTAQAAAVNSATTDDAA